MPRPRKVQPATPLPEVAVPFALLTPPEVAAMLGSTVATLADWRVDRVGPPWIPITPRCIRYQLRDLQAWIESKRIDPITIR